eukprot:2610362-Rhodomonas_salina.2
MPVQASLHHSDQSKCGPGVEVFLDWGRDGHLDILEHHLLGKNGKGELEHFSGGNLDLRVELEELVAGSEGRNCCNHQPVCEEEWLHFGKATGPVLLDRFRKLPACDIQDFAVLFAKFALWLRGTLRKRGGREDADQHRYQTTRLEHD